ncbi:MAG TPA: SMP-30/gluconolactonase/LRE family protein [Candidatus Limnocylindria bacterium]|nr:SMP-30/gluconolactonase/LRE family protein [Candidatus Limnocylindria bacterium]
MKALAAVLLALLGIVRTWAVDDYQLGPDSQPKDGIPHGKVTSFVWTNSTIFPGTFREGSVYVPSQYDGSKPAAVMIFQDGHAYDDAKGSQRVPIVFDNLIARGEMPVTIAIFINPGHKGEFAKDKWAGSNRSFEYDSLGDQYSRFICDEILPYFAKQYNLTTDPELRAIAGMSSGAICAFTVAWERPNMFRKVLSQIGSFTNIRGGHVYPALIRKTERKPIRVFLQDGSNDLNNLHGDWPLANQEMSSALRFTGYDVRFEFGNGGHNGKHGGSILPDSLRWLWRPVMAPPAPQTKDNLGGDEALSKVLPQEGTWELVGEGYGFTDAACGDADGNFYFSDLPKGEVWRVPVNGVPAKWLENGPKISGLKVGPDGRFYAVTQAGEKDKPKVVAIDPQTKAITEIANDVKPNDLVVSKVGWVYFTDTGAGQVQMVPITAQGFGRPRPAAGGIRSPNGIALSPNQDYLAVSEYGGTNVWHYYLREDGTLMGGERYMTLRTVGEKPDSAGDGMTTDFEGRYYVTSRAGIQMFDRVGRMGGVIAPPNSNACVSVAFAGPKREWLYVCNGQKIWRRRTLTHGI